MVYFYNSLEKNFRIWSLLGMEDIEVCNARSVLDWVQRTSAYALQTFSPVGSKQTRCRPTSSRTKLKSPLFLLSHSPVAADPPLLLPLNFFFHFFFSFSSVSIAIEVLYVLLWNFDEFVVQVPRRGSDLLRRIRINLLYGFVVIQGFWREFEERQSR